MNRRHLVSRAVLVMALAVAIIWLGLHRGLLQLATIERQLQRFGAWAPILFVFLYALATVLFVPGSVLTLAGGALFGPIWGYIVESYRRDLGRYARLRDRAIRRLRLGGGAQQ